MGTLEKAIGELGQTLRTVSTLSAQTLAMTGQLGGDGGEPINVAAEGLAESDSTKSYMIKKGDEDVQEAHRAATSVRPSMTTGVSGSGALSAEAKSKDEMDQARR